jgi:CYTH domain-containing protein
MVALMLGFLARMEVLHPRAIRRMAEIAGRLSLGMRAFSFNALGNFARHAFTRLMPRRHHVSSREIERKFLIKRLPLEILRSRQFRIKQGYLATETGGRHVRLRQRARMKLLTFKVGRGVAREEREIRLSAKQFAVLWPATAGRRLRKVRFEVRWKNFTVEIDVYQGRNRPLVIAEVEFPSEASYRKFKPPSWFGREVTGEKRYSNVRLARE